MKSRETYLVLLSLQPTKGLNSQPQLQSHRWTFMRTPADISSHCCATEVGVFLGRPGDIHGKSDNLNLFSWQLRRHFKPKGDENTHLFLCC